MRAEQANKLCKPRRRMGVKVWFQKFGLSLPVIITDRPKTVISLRFYLFYVQFLPALNVLILTLLCVQFIQFTKGN